MTKQSMVNSKAYNLLLTIQVRKIEKKQVLKDKDTKLQMYREIKNLRA